MEHSKVCLWCGERKSLDEYHKKRDAKDGRQRYCKLCKAAIGHAENQTPEGKEKRRVRSRNWLVNNREVSRANLHAKRARKKQSQSFAITAKELKRLYAQKCFYCHDVKATELDHVLPISRGGNNGIGNLVPSCKSCNTSKSNKTIMEWRVWKLRVKSRE